MELANLNAHRDMAKVMVSHLEAKGEKLAMKKDKTAAEIAELSVKLWATRNELHTIQYNINKLIMEW